MAVATVGATYRHFKGGVYHVLALARDANTGDHVVVYGDGTNTWVRGRDEFEGVHETGVERFTRCLDPERKKES